ncbi:MAG: DUF1694 domain-containing protein [Vagococcus sp.]|uniref:DUF1694 domain-containing protein n=1 Tax=Vagococcus sp. TaxID=1933889 RepID=UPI002FC6DCFA
MGQKDIQDYLDKGMYGTPQIKPDEQKKYLGTYRERVVFAMTSEETTKISFDRFCLEKFSDYPKGTLLIDANADIKVQNHFMKLAQQKQIDFRLVDKDADCLDNQDIAMVFTLDQAVDIEDISVKEKKQTQSIPTKTTTNEKKSGFFKKLFS